jgi:hypothetical protein
MSATASLAFAAPSTSSPQHLRALERANEVRLARASLKRRIGTGEIAVSHVLLTRPWEADTMEVCDLLLSQRRWGLMRARKALATIPIPENKRVGALTDRQRTALAHKLARTAP